MLRDTKLPVSPKSGSIIDGKLKNRDLPKYIVMSERGGSKNGGEFVVTAKNGRTLVIAKLKEMVAGAHPVIEPFIMRVKFPVSFIPDQSYSLNVGEKVTAVGLETEISV